MTTHADHHGDGPRRPEGHHDWHSAEYVDNWITTDVTRDDQRRPLVRRMLELAPFEADVPIAVLDVGGGYGVLSEEVLNAFPNCQVTLQDYSTPMLEQARQRLTAYADRMAFEQRDFTRPDWTDGLGGPFDLAISGIAIHNLGPNGPIAQVYQGICGVIKPGGAFLDLDYVSFTGGLEQHLQWLRDAGFSRVEQAWEVNSQSALTAFRS